MSACGILTGAGTSIQKIFPRYQKNIFLKFGDGILDTDSSKQRKTA